MKRQRERERSWRRTASSQLQQRGLADLDPGWVGMILAKQLREMTAVRQGQTDRDSSLSPSLSSMFLLSPLSLLPVMAIDFSQPKQEAPLSPEVAELVKRSQKKERAKSLKWSVGGRKKKVRKAKGANVRWGGDSQVDPVRSELGCADFTPGMSENFIPERWQGSVTPNLKKKKNPAPCFCHGDEKMIIFRVKWGKPNFFFFFSFLGVMKMEVGHASQTE